MFMTRRLLALVLCVTSAPALFGSGEYPEFDQPPHQYWKRPLHDRFSRVKEDLESGRLSLDRTSEKAFVTSLLKVLDIPISSQMLVFSTTSLQLSLISPSNPRALYFAEDLYVGYVPGGRIEVLSLDPELGGIFYIFSIPKGDQQQTLHIERSERCMNCHAGSDTHHVPGLVIKSVVPGPSGGSLTAYRVEQTGHSIPISARFGGWYVTGAPGLTNHWGNLTGRLSPEGLTTFPMQPGQRFNWARYPAATSDILPQLLHEHQAGFVNRILEATYKTRALLGDGKGRLTSEQVEELETMAQSVVQYLLFEEEAALPNGGLEGNDSFKKDFLRTRRSDSSGRSLKDLDLRTRLFKHRCSYMIYSSVFNGLPGEMKQRVYRRMQEALDTTKPEKQFAYLPTEEKKAIRGILKETLSDLPVGW